MKYLFALSVILLALACGDDEPPPPQVDHLVPDLTVLRFDEAFRDTSLAGLEAFGSFTDVYFRQLIPLRRGDISPTEAPAVVQAYFDYPLTQLVDSAVEVFLSRTQVQAMVGEFEQSLGYYKHYLPDAPLPDTLVLYQHLFELAAFLYGDGQLAAGLEFFLSPGFDYRRINPQEPIFSDYLTRTYTPGHFPGKLLRVLLEDRFPPPRAGNVLDHLIYRGKQLYLLERLLPHAPDHVVYEVTEDQLAWLRDNETEIYAYLQREELLFSTEVDKINRYTRPAPGSPGMPPESPGGAVNYLGRQIVASFLAANPDVTAQEMMAMNDAQEILRRARYKPRG